MFLIGDIIPSLFIEEMKKPITKYSSNLYSKGQQAEDAIVDAIRTLKQNNISIKFWRMPCGSCGDVKYKIDLVILLGRTPIIVQIKAGNGLKDTLPWVSREWLSLFKVKPIRKVIHVWEDNRICHKELLMALESLSEYVNV